MNYRAIKHFIAELIISHDFTRRYREQAILAVRQLCRSHKIVNPFRP